MNTIPTRTPAELLQSGTDTAFLAEFLEHWAQVMPTKPSHRFIDYSESRKGIEHVVTFAELERWTRALAAKVMELTQPGDRVALLVPQGSSYIAAFVACLRTQTINVPLYAPDLPGHAERLQAVVADAAPTLILTTTDKLELTQQFCDEVPGAPGLQILCVDEFREGHDELAASYQWPTDLDFDDVAYLQYTSGSTRTPAGVVLTHRNLAVNVMQLINGHDLPFPGATCVSWLPLFHDMGLLLGAAGPVVGGAESVLLDPVAFILKPLRWLQAVSGRTDTITAAPNFAYDYAVKRIKEADREGLDL
ncbi:MAG: AMP-binding protein, partial [Solirubrobacteraceae bacterium]|nr:AMP-binding protein [Solirubrobacteraceae bacterium]